MIEIEPRVARLESNQGLLQQELHQMNTTLGKIEQAIEKQNEISTDIRLLRQEFKSHIELELNSAKRQHDRIDGQDKRIESLENTRSKIGYTIVLAVVGALLTLVLRSNS